MVKQQISILEQIKLLEPFAESFYQGQSYVVVKLNNGQQVALSRQLLEGLERPCLGCQQQVKLYSTAKGWAKFNLDGTPHKDPRKVRAK